MEINLEKLSAAADKLKAHTGKPKRKRSRKATKRKHAVKHHAVKRHTTHHTHRKSPKRVKAAKKGARTKARKHAIRVKAAKKAARTRKRHHR